MTDQPTPRDYRIAVLPGDGIGHEVVPAAMEVVAAAGRRFGFTTKGETLPWGCEFFSKTGRMMPADALDQLRGFDAILLGACGYPGVPDHVSLWGMLIPIRRNFLQYANVRPIKLFPGVPCPLVGRKPGDIDFVVVRENVEGEYSEIGGRIYQGTDDEMAMQQAVFTRRGTDRILRFAFNLARERRCKVTSATKSNGIVHTMPFWDERFATIAKGYPDVTTDQYHIDILTAHFVQHPDWFDVVVGSNLFGDILSDLGPAIAGSIGIAPSANLNPEGDYPSMFEPVHGSAPDIAGKGIANPVATIWSAAMMLRHLGEAEAADGIEAAMAESLVRPETRTRDLGGHADTRGATEAVLAALK